MPEFLKRRLPAKSEIFLALSVVTLLVFSWELRSLFYNAPAFLLSYTLARILSIAAYMLAVALLETLTVTLFAVALAMILPGAILRNGFSYKASFLFIALAVVSIQLQFTMNNQPKISYLVGKLVFALFLWLIPVLLVQFFPRIRALVLDLFDRLTIFSYIYLPLGILSLFVMIVRLIW